MLRLVPIRFLSLATRSPKKQVFLSPSHQRRNEAWALAGVSELEFAGYVQQKEQSPCLTLWVLLVGMQGISGVKDIKASAGMERFCSAPSFPIKSPHPQQCPQSQGDSPLQEDCCWVLLWPCMAFASWEMLVSLLAPPASCAVKGNLLNFSVMG